MAMPDEESLCYRHGWIGKGTCPRCKEEKKSRVVAYQKRWEAMTLEERVEELRRRLNTLTQGDDS